MSEIKFACPHCGQHIACDGDFVSLEIECPACGGSLVVPRIAITDTRHPSTVIVASTPSPKHVSVLPTPVFVPYSEQNPPPLPRTAFPPWLIGALATLMVAFFLRINNASLWNILLCLVAGAVVTGILTAKDQRGDQTFSYQVLRGICLAIIILPVAGITILFLGCTVCAAAG